jgi:hypothetical protein
MERGRAIIRKPACQDGKNNYANVHDVRSGTGASLHAALCSVADWE